MTDLNTPTQPPTKALGCGFIVAVAIFILFGLICLLVTYVAHSIVYSSLPKHDGDVLTMIALAFWTVWLVFLILIARARRKRN